MYREIWLRAVRICAVCCEARVWESISFVHPLAGQWSLKAQALHFDNVLSVAHKLRKQKLPVTVAIAYDEHCRKTWAAKVLRDDDFVLEEAVKKVDKAGPWCAINHCAWGATLSVGGRRWGHSTSECGSPGATLPVSAFSPCAWATLTVGAFTSSTNYCLFAQELLAEVMSAFEDAKGKGKDKDDFGALP